MSALLDLHVMLLFSLGIVCILLRWISTSLEFRFRAELLTFETSLVTYNLEGVECQSALREGNRVIADWHSSQVFLCHLT
jgi:hypothetical protein